MYSFSPIISSLPLLPVSRVLWVENIPTTEDGHDAHDLGSSNRLGYLALIFRGQSSNATGQYFAHVRDEVG